jgi:tetratricopeptide (TPR) repeat protein
VLALLLSGAPSRGDEGPSPDELEAARQAVRLLEEGDDPGPRVAADAHAHLARLLARAGEWEEALGSFEAALRLVEDAALRLGHARALLHVARRNIAAPNPTASSVVPYLNDALASAGRADDPAMALERDLLVAEARYLLGDLAEATEVWGRLDLAKAPAGAAADARGLWADALYRLGRFAEAAAQWEALGNVRGQAAAWAAAKDGARATELFVRLLRERPDDETLLADALSAARYTDARAALSEALSTLEAEGPARARILRARATLAEESGDAAGAVPLYREAVDADPTSAAAAIDLGRMLLLAEGASPSEAAREAAVAAWLEALRREPAHERVRSILWAQAGIDYEAGARAGGSPSAFERSLRVQRALAQSAPDDALAWANLGNSLRVAGDVEGSKDAYRRALAENPFDPSIWSDQGLTLSGAGELEAALASYAKALEVDPGFVSAHQNAGRLRWLAGEDDLAEAHYGAALRRSRAQGTGEGLFRFLLDRTWRTRLRPDVR